MKGLSLATLFVALGFIILPANLEAVATCPERTPGVAFSTNIWSAPMAKETFGLLVSCVDPYSDEKISISGFGHVRAEVTKECPKEKRKVPCKCGDKDATIAIVFKSEATTLSKCIPIPQITQAINASIDVEGLGPLRNLANGKSVQEILKPEPTVESGKTRGLTIGNSTADPTSGFTAQQAKDFLVNNKLMSREDANKLVTQNQAAIKEIANLAGTNANQAQVVETVGGLVKNTTGIDLKAFEKAVGLEPSVPVQTGSGDQVEPDPVAKALLGTGATFSQPAPQKQPDISEQVPLGEIEVSDLSRDQLIKRTAEGFCQGNGGGCDPQQFQEAMLRVKQQECGNAMVCWHGAAKDPTTKIPYFNPAHVGIYGFNGDKNLEDFKSGLNTGLNAIKGNDPALHEEAIRRYSQIQAEGGDPRADSVLNVVAAVGNHGPSAVHIQGLTDDPAKQAAIHMMIQLMPSETKANLKDPNAFLAFNLHADSLKSLASNSVKFTEAQLKAGVKATNVIDAMLENRSYAALQKTVQVAALPASPVDAAVPAPTPESTQQSIDLRLARIEAWFAERMQLGSPMAQTNVLECTVNSNGQLLCPVGTPTKIGSPAGGGFGGMPSLGGGGGGSSGGGSGGGYSQPISYQPPRPPIPQPQPTPTPTPAPTPTPPKAVAVLIAQPSQVARGGTVTVSWSSVGMSASSPCQIRLEFGTSTSAFAGGNEGSKQLSMNASTTPGTQKFILQCTAQAGEAVEQSATVTII